MSKLIVRNNRGPSKANELGLIAFASEALNFNRLSCRAFDLKVTLTFVLIVALQFTLLGATEIEATIEKTVKVREQQSSNNAQQLQSQLTSAGANKGLQQSNLGRERKANYKDISDPSLSVEGALAGTGKNSNTVSSGTNRTAATVPVVRDKNSTTKLLSHDFFFDSVYVTMDYDSDGDGYYSEFSVNFDADTNFSSATVYARLYLSLNGAPWELYYTSQYFNLEGYSAYDDFTVSTILTSGYPPGSYDILIDLYDEYNDSLVATISSDDDYELANHYLEDVSFESTIVGDSRYTIFSSSITLLTDNDQDGFYQSFSLQFDADINSGDALIYAEIWIQDNTGSWELDFTTEDYLIDGFSTLDTYILESTLESGYQTGYYNFKIEIYDAYTDAFLTSSDNVSAALSDVPLEDRSSDAVQNSGGVSTTEPTSSHSHGDGGAGSSGLMILLVLFASYFRRFFS